MLALELLGGRGKKHRVGKISLRRQVSKTVQANSAAIRLDWVLVPTHYGRIRVKHSLLKQNISPGLEPRAGQRTADLHDAFPFLKTYQLKLPLESVSLF